ncbi:RNA-binding transcriptional accessory protein, partial [bacterium]|nr:RNA-binding transcriptional accessory protein [bacterium]
MNVNITPKVSQQLNIPEKYIITVLNLLEEGATIPFIARYRKEKTAGLDEEQLRKIVLTYESENKIYTRREEVLRLINEKGKMTPELEESLR